MNALRLTAMTYLALTLGNQIFGATLASQVHARRLGGTATGSFVEAALPSFLLAPL